MTPPRPYLCFCPACGCPGIIWERSGNSFGATLCSDGLFAGSMIPKQQALLIHPECQHYIWHSELHNKLPDTLSLKAVTSEKPGERACFAHPAYLELKQTLDSWREDVDLDFKMEKILSQNFVETLDFDLKLTPVDAASAWEEAWQLGVAGVEAERQRFLLRHWWWSINHVQGSWDEETDEYIPPPPPDQLMLTRCLKALLPLLTEPEHQLDRAEALRELGHFEEATLCYQAITPSSLDALDQLRYPLIGRLIEEGSTELKYAESQGFTMFL